KLEPPFWTIRQFMKPSASAIFSRPPGIEQQFERSADQDHQHYRRLWPVFHLAAPYPRTSLARGGNVQSRGPSPFLEVWRRCSLHHDLQLLSIPVRRRIHLQGHQ